MKLGKCSAQNFGSYTNLEIDFSDPGLNLIYGRTGSGKSTIPDLPCWAIFGCSAKGGSVDEVRSWHIEYEPTKVVQVVDINGKNILITRIRGKANQNDLYFQVDGSDPTRGKDIKDTQKLLNAILGIDADLYLSAAYFSEFSHSSRFFLISNRQRRDIFELLTDLTLPVNLASKASDSRKATKIELLAAQTLLAKNESRIEQMERSIALAEKSAKDWANEQISLIAAFKAEAKSFETNKANKIKEIERKISDFDNKKTEWLKKSLGQLNTLETKLLDSNGLEKNYKDLTWEIENLSPDKCLTCGALCANSEKEELQERLTALRSLINQNNIIESDMRRLKKEVLEREKQLSPYIENCSLEQAQLEINHYEEQADLESSKVNPFNAQLVSLKTDKVATAVNLKAYKVKAEDLEHRVSALTQLYDLSFSLRSELLNKAVTEIEDSTNRYLRDFFDSEIQVKFILGADTFDISIQKSGYECVYSQLSKGQRCLLKLTFMISLMKASANKAATHFDTLFFDEALEGLDEDLKLKAFNLFEQLEQEHTSIFVVEHSVQFQQLFDKRYHVELMGDNSKIEIENG